MSVAIFLLDESWAEDGPWFNPRTGCTDGPLRFARDFRYRSEVVLVSPAEGPGEYIPRVVAAASADRLAVLSIGARGAPAGDSSSCGLGLGPGLTPEAVGAFAALRDCFPRPGWAEKVIRVFSCEVIGQAKGCEGSPTGCPRGVFTGRACAAGHELLQSMADLTGATVQASEDSVLRFAPHFFSFDGVPSVYFYPNGIGPKSGLHTEVGFAAFRTSG